MKKQRYLLFILIISLILCGCGQQRASADLSPEQILSSVLQSQTGLPEMCQLTPQDADFAAFLADDYGIDPEKVADGVIAYADGVEASEMVLLTLAEERDAPAAQAALTAYAQRRAELFEGYAPAQAAMAGKARAIVSGRYAALLIYPDAAAAETALLNCLNDAPTGRFDSGAILAAWRSGDASALSETDRQILDAAREVVAQETSDGMSDYEKELAIHDWLTHWSSFDMSAFSRNPGSGEGGDSDTPYGVLIHKSGNCWGYASTFQLLMDMVEVECLTVYGTPRSSGVEHAWNMVRLDGEWYCVDAAWDDPIGGSPNHRYFNATSEAFRNSGIHHWDESAYPEATGTAYGGR